MLNIGTGQDGGVAIARLPPRMETDRVVLRPRVEGDAAICHEMWLERDPRVPPHRRIGLDGRPTVEDIAARIRAQQDSRMSDFLMIVRKREGDVIGYCGLLYGLRGSSEDADLAYELVRRAHGAGYGTEAAGAVAEWAGGVGYRRLWANVRAWNLPSRNVLRKLSFVETGDVEPDAMAGDLLTTVRVFGDYRECIQNQPKRRSDDDSHRAAAAVTEAALRRASPRGAGAA